jgi:hypothetical protein
MRRPNYDANPPITSKTENKFPDMAQAVIHQQQNIFINKLLEILKFIQVEDKHTANIFLNNFLFMYGFA